jgi:hypothetical protein
MSMIEAELSLFEVQIEGVCWDSFELCKAQLGIGPE